jgi:hypothetical protein
MFEMDRLETVPFDNEVGGIRLQEGLHCLATNPSTTRIKQVLKNVLEFSSRYSLNR